MFVVNADNPVDSLSVNQVRAVFSPPGVSNWIELGGSDRTVEPYQRQEDSGSQELMRKLVMRDLRLLDPESAPLIYTMGGVVNTMAVREDGIGFSVYYYVLNMAPNPAAKMIAIEGIRPDASTIESGDYPLTAPVFAAVRSDASTESAAVMLRDWLLTDQGRG